MSDRNKEADQDNLRIWFVGGDGLGRLFKMVLEGKGGYSVLADIDAEATLDRGREFRPDIVIIHFYGSTAPRTLALAEEVARDSSFDYAPILFHTSMWSKNEAEQLCKSGLPVLAQPASPAELRAFMVENFRDQKNAAASGWRSAFLTPPLPVLPP